MTLLKQSAEVWKEIPLLAKTHGQPASPTKLGKEIEVYITRLNEQIKLLKEVPNAAKFGGANGNFNAHCVAYPKVNWHQFAHQFVNDVLGLNEVIQQLKSNIMIILLQSSIPLSALIPYLLT